MLLIALPVDQAATGTARAEATARAQHRDDPYAVHIAEAARRFGIPETWIRAAMEAESAGDAQAVSPKGAMGLMQIMPDTWEDLRARYGLASDPFDPRDNVLTGAAYMRELLDRYGSSGFLAAYNAGPARYEEHLATGRSLPFETQAYVARLAPLVGAPFAGTIGAARAGDQWIVAPLFAKHDCRSSNGSPVAMPVLPERRFESSPAADLRAILPRSDGLFVLHGTPGGRR